jgi:hypothetical protein
LREKLASGRDEERREHRATHQLQLAVLELQLEVHGCGNALNVVVKPSLTQGGFGVVRFVSHLGMSPWVENFPYSIEFQGYRTRQSPSELTSANVRSLIAIAKN